METPSDDGHGTTLADPITVRTMNFPLPGAIDPIIMAGEPEESYTLIGVSLLLPYLEPYLIRTMKVARSHLSDPVLLADLGKFSAQEGQHYRQHRRFNEAVHASGFPRLTALEEELSRDYQRFSDERPLAFNLAYAEGFEAFTTALARFVLEERWLDRMPPAVRDLFGWHLIEELEHRTVAFDVYERISGNYGRRVLVSLYAQWHLLRFVIRATAHMLDATPDVVARYGGVPAQRARFSRLRAQLAKGLLPKVLATYSPWYTPHAIEMPAEARDLARHYTEMATTLGSR